MGIPHGVVAGVVIQGVDREITARRIFKVAAKGVSAEALRHAKEKFQQINEAYERITEARKV